MASTPWALPAELTRVDALLDDRLFLVPFGGFFDPRIGRPSTAMETYLRLMFLKFRYRLGYESLCREVADSITWRRFTRIGLAGRVPDPTTLMKLEFIGNTAYVVTLAGEVWKIANVSVPPHRG
jgi:IS5 family transposase